REIQVLAHAPRHGLAWKNVGPDARKAEVEIRLLPEQVVKGRFLDLQGQPAAGVRVGVSSLTGQAPKKGVSGFLQAPGAGLPFGPTDVTTDREGQFTLRGVGQDLTAWLRIRDDRYSLDDLAVDTRSKDKAEGVRTVLVPAHAVEGVVTCADTG